MRTRPRLVGIPDGKLAGGPPRASPALSFPTSALNSPEAEREASTWVDVVTYAKTPKRPTMAACRRGDIVGAVKRGRVWVAPCEAVDGWLRAVGPRPVKREDGLEGLRSPCRRGSR